MTTNFATTNLAKASLAAALAVLALLARGIAIIVPAKDFAADLAHGLWICALYAVVWGLPNTQQIMHRFAPALGRVQPGRLQVLAWQPRLGWALALGVLASLGVLAIGGTSEFLYFQF